MDVELYFLYALQLNNAHHRNHLRSFLSPSAPAFLAVLWDAIPLARPFHCSAIRQNWPKTYRAV